MSDTEVANVNPFNMNKKELVLYMTGRCKHYHKYIEHPNCFLEEQGKKLKIGYLDIEATGLVANIDVMLTWAIKTRDKNEFYTGKITKKELFELSFDKRICNELISALDKYDIIITYYGTKYDIPFMRSRCLEFKLPFITFGYVKHKDVYYMVKRLLKLNRNSLEAVTKFFGIEGKDHLDLATWRKARYGDPKALAHVMYHNIEDVKILEELHKKLEAYDKGLAKSM